MTLSYEQIQWRDAPDTSTPVNSENLNRMDAMIAQIVNYLNTNTGGIHSHVGMVIQSTTLDTQDKVIAEYGGSEWLPIRGKFLIGADEDSYPVNTEGGTADSVVPVHTHSITATGDTSMAAHTHALNASNSSYEESGRVRVYKPAGASVFARPSEGQDAGNAFTTLESYTINAKSATAGIRELKTHTHTCQAAGEDGKGKNLPPYLAVYTWVRTA